MSAGWNTFAAVNGGERAAAEHVLHRPIWKFIVDATTREFYRRIFSGLRAKQNLSETGYRFHTPAEHHGAPVSLPDGRGSE